MTPADIGAATPSSANANSSHPWAGGRPLTLADIRAGGTELAGPLTEAQRSRLLEIAEERPVHRTLESAIDIRARLTA